MCALCKLSPVTFMDICHVVDDAPPLGTDSRGGYLSSAPTRGSVPGPFSCPSVTALSPNLKSLSKTIFGDLDSNCHISCVGCGIVWCGKMDIAVVILYGWNTC